MEIKKDPSPSKVLQQVEACLLKKEAENNLPLGLLNRLTKDEKSKVRYAEGMEPFAAYGKNEDGSTGVVMVQTPPYNLIICGEERHAEKAANWLFNEKKKIPGVVGCKPMVDHFAKAWKELTGCQLQTFMRQKIYRLDEVKDVNRKNGRLCYATEDDIALAAYWTEKFHSEALEPIDKKTVMDFVKSRIKQNQIFFWRTEQGTPVSMAARSRESKHGVVINLVYTPNEYKKQGYATTCVAALSEWLLQEGYKFCSLYTDLDNPTSNSIYMKIGYEPIADSIEYRFKE